MGKCKSGLRNWGGEGGGTEGGEIREETLCEPRHQPLNSLQTIGVGNKVWQARLHSVLKMGPNQHVKGGGGPNPQTDSK